MRHFGKIQERFRHQLSGHYKPTDTQPSPTSLLETELTLYLLETVAHGQSVSGAPSLLDGYRTLWDAVAEPPADASIRLANARTLLWRTQRPYGWDEVVRAYLTVPAEVRGYDLDLLKRPTRRDCRVAGERWDWYERLLTEPLPFRTTNVRLAEPGRHRMSSTAHGIGVDIPNDLPGIDPQATHNLAVRDRKPIEVTWTELLETAHRMDETDKVAGRRNHWEERLRDVTLQVRAEGHSFEDTETLRIDRILHLVGLVSVGKSTLVMILATWAAQNQRRVTIVVGDNSAALRAAEELSRYDGVRAAPVMGSNRSRHTERLHHLQPPATGRVLPIEPYGFDLVSTACALDGIRDGAAPLAVREAPCQHLIATKTDESVDGWRERPRRTCPLWHGCQRHEAARRLVDANIWIATPWSLVHTPVPEPLTGEKMRYLEAAWRRSDLIVVDEADQVQANLDEMFANAQVLLGSSDEAWIDEIGARVSDKLRASGRAPARSRIIRQFTTALNHARTVAESIYQMLHRDQARVGKPVLKWLDADYFKAWTLFGNLAQDWTGLARPERGRPAVGWDSNPLFLHLRDEFNTFIDDPTKATGEVAAGLTRLAEVQLSDTEEDAREASIRQWLMALATRELVDGEKVELSNLDHSVWRLELAIAVAVMEHRLNLMLNLWPEVAAELNMHDALPTEVRRAPSDLTVVVPESPMGNVLGFQYVEDQASSEGPLGEFRFFRYSGVGRSLLTRLPDLFPADGHGPNVLLLSGTSWAGVSPRYHIDVPVTAILRPPQEKLDVIAGTKFALDIQHAGERSTPIWVSGRYGAERTNALRLMVTALTRPGAGPGQPSRLERERKSLSLGRQKIMLLVGSYAEARAVTDELLRRKASWQGQIRCLVGDDEQETGWDDSHLLRRTYVSEFGTDDNAWLLVAPILAVERGHNILNTEGVAAIGAAFFLVRPHPRPKDLSYVTQRINQYALKQMEPQPVDETCADHERLAIAGKQRRQAAQRQWRGLLHALVAYSRLGDDERKRVAWTQLVTIWQVIGRLLRGGQSAKVYFCDAAFAPHTAQRGDDEAGLDDATTSLLYGMRDVLVPYFDPECTDPDRYLVRALYKPLHQAFATMGDR